MKLLLAIAASLMLATPAMATCFPDAAGTSCNPGEVPMVVNPQGQSVPASASAPLPVTAVGPTGGPQVVAVSPSGQCPPNPISKIAGPWPFCK